MLILSKKKAVILHLKSLTRLQRLSICCLQAELLAMVLEFISTAFFSISQMNSLTNGLNGWKLQLQLLFQLQCIFQTISDFI